MAKSIDTLIDEQDDIMISGYRETFAEMNVEELGHALKWYEDLHSALSKTQEAGTLRGDMLKTFQRAKMAVEMIRNEIVLKSILLGEE